MKRNYFVVENSEEKVPQDFTPEARRPVLHDLPLSRREFVVLVRNAGLKRLCKKYYQGSFALLPIQIDNMDILTLDLKGVILAFIIATVMYDFGAHTTSYLGYYYVAVMIYFLVLSAIVTRVGVAYKKKVKLYQTTRGVKNVIANGLGPLIFIVLVYFLSQKYGFVAVWLGVVGFAASVAAVTSDKFSSEIGVLNGDPISIISLKKIKKGISGGITVLGMEAGFFASLLISLVTVPVYLFLSHQLYMCPKSGFGACVLTNVTIFWIAIVAVTLGGFIGTLVDSYFGVFEERGWGNKYTTNFLCSVIGGCAGIVIYLLL